MGKPLSVDLRSRVIAAVDGGLSRRQAAERFGVSVSSAIRWTSLARRTRDVRPRPQGGDNRSARIERHAPLILEALDDTPDITLAEVQNRLAGHGVGVAISALWRFFRRRRNTLKSRAMPLNKTGPTSSIVAAPGLKGNSTSTRRA